MGWRPSTWQMHPIHIYDRLCTLQSMWPKSPQTKDCSTWPWKGAGFPYFWFKRKRLPCETLHAAGSHHTHYKQKGLENDFYKETCISSVQLLSHIQLFATPWSAGCQASLSITNSWSYPNSCPLSQWCHPTISSSVIPFSSCVQSFPASGSFPVSQFFTSGGQRIGVSVSISVLPVNTEDWSSLGRTGWISCQGTLESLLQHQSSKASILQCSAFFIVQLSHPYMTTGKTIALTRQTFVGKVMSPLFNMLSRLVIAFLPRSKSLLISWLQSSAVIWNPPK